MIALPNKSKQYGLIALKVLILSVTFGYIYAKLTGDNSVSFGEFLNTVSSKSWWPIALFFMLATLNWCLEILKWQLVVSAIKKISFKKAAKQSLASLTVSLATPNRIGEYGAKAYFYPSEERKKILLLNLFSSLSQMLVTVILGIIGLFIIVKRYSIEFSTLKISLGFLLLFASVVFAYIFRHNSFFIKGFSIAKVTSFIVGISKKIQIRTFFLSALRYALFSSLFFFLLKFFGVKVSAQVAFPLIFSMYFLSSIIPSFFLFDVVIKGGIAIWLLSLVGIPEWPILCTVMAMWLLNFVAPGIFGSFYVVNHQSS